MIWGQPASPLIALGGGVIAWRLMRGVSNRFGFDTRWFDFGRLFDSFAGLSMGGLRGVALVSSGCLAYAMVLVPLGLANPLETVAYPVFLSVGSQVTSAVIAKVEPLIAATPGDTAGSQSFASVPLPLIAPQIGTPAATVAAVPGAALASLIHAVAPSAVAATMLPPAAMAVPAYHPDIPVRQVPVSLIETHHNLLHPHGLFVRRIAHR